MGERHEWGGRFSSLQEETMFDVDSNIPYTCMLSVEGMIYASYCSTPAIRCEMDVLWLGESLKMARSLAYVMLYGRNDLSSCRGMQLSNKGILS